MATTEIFQDWDSPHENISSMTRTTTRKTTTRREVSFRVSQIDTRNQLAGLRTRINKSLNNKLICVV
ncbi:hypothetical protein M0802_007230 [Mischocyttarus mexicanus]|nr:hypothetical protein M0802_007230 [Mischocyttarus mexicanus]